MTMFLTKSSSLSSPLTSALAWAFLIKANKNLADLSQVRNNESHFPLIFPSSSLPLTHLTGQRPWTTPWTLAWAVRPTDPLWRRKGTQAVWVWTS